MVFDFLNKVCYYKGMDIKRPSNLDFPRIPVNHHPIVGAGAYNLDLDDTIPPEMLEDSKEHPHSEVGADLAKAGLINTVSLPNFER